MKFLDAIFSGSIYISGSFTPPKGTRDQRPTNPVTASVFFETSDSGSRLLIYNGSGSDGWQEVGLQDDPVPSPSLPPQADIEYLVVAGGGGGGGESIAGGGGAGGYLSSSLSSIESGSSITVTVGGGGTGGSTVPGNGVNGGNSSIASAGGTTFTTVTSTGGGGGAGGGQAGTAAGSGGSGGGGAYTNATAGGSGTQGQGFDGGDGAGTQPGGGGGASEEGNTDGGGHGGDGKQSSITGTATYYAGGGGGSLNSGPAKPGGDGGGGASYGFTPQTNAVAGTPNTGGGGGGGYTGGTGGSGVVILAYPSSSINAAGGIVGDAGNGRKYHQFNASGTFKVGSTSDFGIVTDSLVAHYDAGNFASRGTSTWTNLTGNSNLTNTNATLGSNPYYSFNGSTSYMISDSQITTAVNNNITIEFWVRSNSSTQDQYADIIDANHSTAAAGSTGTGWVIQQDNLTHNNFYFAYHDGSSYQVTSNFTLTPSTWEHITIVKNNTNVQIYKNSTVSVNSTLTNANMANPTQKLWICDYASGPDRNFNGDLGQIRIYSTNLSTTQLTQNYNATKTNFV